MAFWRLKAKHDINWKPRVLPNTRYNGENPGVIPGAVVSMDYLTEMVAPT